MKRLFSVSLIIFFGAAFLLYSDSPAYAQVEMKLFSGMKARSR